MTKKFKLIFETDTPDIQEEEFQRILPSNFMLQKSNGNFYLIVETKYENDQSAYYLVERELDRYFFLTSVKVKAELVKTRVRNFVNLGYRIHNELPRSISKQIWNYELPIQLRLWAIAIDTQDFRLKIILLFQIIELAYPEQNSYPEYLDLNIPPHPLTESKFLRHLVAHAGEVTGNQLKRYCTYLGLPELMHDITDKEYSDILARKVSIVQEQAEIIIKNQL